MLHRNKRYLRKQIRQNREHHMPQANTFIPRTDRIPVEASHQLSPAEFAEILIKKLEKVKREQELDEKLNKKLAEDAQSMVSQGSNRSLAEILREKLIVTDDLEGDQSILDDHVSRVWTDKTPLRSPGDPSGRPRSPPFPPRRSSNKPIQTPMGPIQPHRTLPGRGHRAQGRRMPGQQVYHQDLAYYEVDRLGRATGGGPTRAADLSGGARNLNARGRDGGNTSRVMEWMQEVERSQGLTDQRSQSSRGNTTKTSPRTARQ